MNRCVTGRFARQRCAFQALDALEPRQLLTSSLNYDGPSVVSLRDAPSDVVVADFTGDGVPDIATAVGRTLSLSRGLGNGQFANPTTVLTLNRNVGRLATGDFNLDGVPDLASVETTTSTAAHPWFRVLLSTRVGFVAAAFEQLQMQPDSLVVGDLDRTGAPEAVVTGRDTIGGLMIGLSYVGGEIVNRGRLASAFTLTGPVIADVRGNGQPMLVFGMTDHTGTSIRAVAPFQFTSGTLTLATLDAVGSVAATDMDGDGRIEIVFSTVHNVRWSLYYDMLNVATVFSTRFDPFTGTLTPASIVYSTDFGGPEPAAEIPKVRLVGTADMNSDGRRDIQIEVFHPGYDADDDDEPLTSFFFKQLINNGTSPVTSIDSFPNGSMSYNAARANPQFYFVADVRGTGRSDVLWLRGPGLTLVSNTVAFKRPRIIGQPQPNLVGPLTSQSAVRFSAAVATAEIMRGVSIAEVRYYLDTNGDGRWDAGDYRLGASSANGVFPLSTTVSPDWPRGSFRILAQASDSLGLTSDFVLSSVSLTIL